MPSFQEENATVDALAKNVPLIPPSINSSWWARLKATFQRPRGAIRTFDLDEEYTKQAHQNTGWRRLLFYWAMLAVSAIVVFSNIAAWRYFNHTPVDNVDATALSTWFAANVVQVIGILLIIARHLFPQEHSRKSEKSSDNT